jgi:hypothetical protein
MTPMEIISTRIVVFAVAAVCLLGCKQELHDPLLRQQLTTMVSSLDDQNASATKKADDDIGAILSVNSAKLSEEQKSKLSTAQMILSQLGVDFARRDLNNSLGTHDEDSKISESISSGISDVKKTISEVAATF